jgi:hypothetical protein
MKQGYLILASLGRVLPVTFNNDNEIRDLLGCGELTHGITLGTENQLLVSGDKGHGMSGHWFFVRKVPIPFPDAGLLVGIIPTDGATADKPVMTIEEFRSLIVFLSKEDVLQMCGDDE